MRFYGLHSVPALVLLFCTVWAVSPGSGSAGGSALGGFRPLDFTNDLEVAQEVDTAARLAVGLIDQQGLSSFGVNGICPESAMPALLGAPTVLEAYAQVVAGTVYRLHFTAPVECSGLKVANTAVVDAEVFQPISFLVGGSPAEPALKSASVQLVPVTQS